MGSPGARLGAFAVIQCAEKTLVFRPFPAKTGQFRPFLVSGQVPLAGRPLCSWVRFEKIEYLYHLRHQGYCRMDSGVKGKASLGVSLPGVKFFALIRMARINSLEEKTIN